MLRTIVRNELRLLLREGTLWIVFCVLVAAIAYALVTGGRWVAFQRATLARAHAEQTERYRQLKAQVVEIDAGRARAPFADPRMPDMVGSRLAWAYAVLPPLALAPFSVGQSDVLPYYLRVSTASRESLFSMSEIENPHHLLHGRFDLSFVIVDLLPLLIIALCYNLMSLEKEEGTLAMLLSQPVSFATLLIVKIGLRVVLLVALVLCLAGAGAVLSGVSLLNAETASRFGMWSVSVAAYAAFWVSLVLGVTALGRGSATNALLLAGTWLLLTIVLPASLNMAVATLYPMPSRVDMIAATRRATDTAAAKGNRLLARYYGDHPELVGDSDLGEAMNDVAITRLAIDEDIERALRPVVEQHDRQLERRQSSVSRLRFLSPAIVAQDAMDDVAGTGTARHRHFMSLVGNYHQLWRAVISAMVVGKQKVTAPMYDQLPRFEYREEPLADVVGRTAVDAAWLVAAFAAVTAWALRRLRYYPITS